MCDLSSLDNMLFPDRLQSVYPPGIKFPNLQDLNHPKEQKENSESPTTGDECYEGLGAQFLIRVQDGVKLGNLPFRSFPFQSR